MPGPESPGLPNPVDAAAYWVDAWQRSVLFLDVMRRRAVENEAHRAEVAPNVLDYKADLVLDGRRLERPVNYLLVRILPPEGVEIDPRKRPFVIVDPRAGHGPGIGGFKADSEIGVAMKAGHPAYFIGFLPDPVPGQTILDIARAEATFLETVTARHPEAEGKPCVIGNCQAGWAVMLVAALRPELFGPIIIAGAPLAYWAGVHGQYPMRYSGGLLGGSWLTALAGDLGAGIFDGAALVQNFENQNPANTLWSKQYNLWSKIDTEPDRYLDFEKWWGGHVTLNAEEIQWIVDELFVGNHLAAGEIRTPDGTAIDLRNVRSPIVVFCSRGDNITPPQQALDWILDLYDDVDEIRAYGQTIVYTIHDKIGHLGIFVSAGVARKEHDEFASNIDLIDVLPPGLYEAVLTPKGEAIDNPELITGEWVMRCEARTLDDIRALGGNDLEDERRFEAAARLSEINLALYRSVLQPWVKAAVTPPMAEAMRRMNPLRLSYEMFGPRNPFLAWVGDAAERVRARRQPVRPGNPLVAAQEQLSQQIVDGLEAWRKAVEKLSEETFLAVYGAPAAAGCAWHRHGFEPAAAQGGEKPDAWRPGGGAYRRAAAGDDQRRAARGAGPGAALCGDGAECCRRARVRGDPPDAEGASGPPADDAGGVQGADPRATLYAQDRRGGRAGGDPGPAPGLDGRAARRLRDAAGGAWRQRRARRCRNRTARPGGRAVRPRDRACDLRPAQRGRRSQGVLSAEARVPDTTPVQSKYDRLIASARDGTPAVTIVAHPCDETSLRGAVEAAAEGLIEPVLVGPETKIRSVAAEHGIDLTGRKIVDAAHSHAAAACAVTLIREGKGELLMKGSLHTDELMREVTASATGLRTDRRISHVFVMDVPGHPETLFITDAAINIFPDLDVKRDIVQNAIDLWVGIGMGTPRVAILSAVETVTTKIPSTIEAAALCKMADRGQITGGMLEGPLAFDNAVDPEAARIKGITSPVAGHAQILVVPDLEAGNMLAKNLSFLAHADAAGIVLGARVPIVLTSRADSVRTRLASCAVAALYANARRAKAAVPAA